MLTRPFSKTAHAQLPVEHVAETPVWQEHAVESRRRPRQLFATFRGHSWIAALLILACDVTCWIVLYGVIGYVRRDAFVVDPLEFIIVDCVALAVLVQALYMVGGYSRNTEMRGLIYTAEHILAVVAAGAISSLLIYSAATFDASIKPSRGVLLVSFVVFLPVSMLYRRFFRRIIAASTAQRFFLVVGSGDLAARFYHAYKNSPNQEQLEFVDDNPARAGALIAGENSPVIQTGVMEKLSQLGPHYNGVILAESVDRLGPKLIETLVRTQFQSARVYTIESFYETHWRHVPMHTIDPFWPLQMGFQLARISPYHYLKRLFDLLASGVLLILFSPIMAITACLIWLTGGRPALFRQTRVGLEGRQFTVYKFRTMETRPNENDDLYTRANDPRVTPVGRWLRKLRLDELPQLWNVFRGDMSLIGPRAEWIKCAEQYDKKIPFYHLRHLVKPGITGWAQVNYPYGESEQDAIQKLQYDLFYIRHYSLTLDAMIVLKTIHTMLSGKGR